MTETFTEYEAPSNPSGVRRLGADSKGNVWFSEYAANQIGSLDPKTGKITEIKLPLKYTHPYETWADKQDNVWTTSHFYNSLIYYDRTMKRFTYYPWPQGTHWSVPKVEVDIVSRRIVSRAPAGAWGRDAPLSRSHCHR